MKEKIKKLFIIFTMALTMSLLNFNAITTVNTSQYIFADGVTIDDKVVDDDSSLNTTVGKVLGIIIVIARIMGVIMIAAGVYKLVSDYFVNDDPSSLKRSVSFIIVGFILAIALKPMIQAILDGVSM